VGWEYCHVAIDDTSRLAYVEILGRRTRPDLRRVSPPRSGWFACHGVTVQQVMTDIQAVWA
jgi:hypothetical protein